MKYVPTDGNLNFIKSKYQKNQRQEKEPILEIVISPRSPWASISYVQDRHVLGTKLACNNWRKTGCRKKQYRGCLSRRNAGRFVVSLFPLKSEVGWLFRVVPRGTPWCGPRSLGQWVVRGPGVSVFNSPLNFARIFNRSEIRSGPWERIASAPLNISNVGDFSRSWIF